MVAEIGPDVTNTCYVDGVGITECSCFKTQNGPTDCFGRRGATKIRIIDDDGKNLHNQNHMCSYYSHNNFYTNHTLC